MISVDIAISWIFIFSMFLANLNVFNADTFLFPYKYWRSLRYTAMESKRFWKAEYLVLTFGSKQIEFYRVLFLWPELFILLQRNYIDRKKLERGSWDANDGMRRLRL